MNFISRLQKLRTLRGKFLLFVLPPMIVCFLIFSVIFTVFSYKDKKQHIISKLKSYAQTQSSILAKSLWDVNFEVAEAQIKSMLLIPDLSGVKVLEFTTGVTIQAGSLPDENSIGEYFEVQEDIVYKTPNEEQRIGKLSIVSRKNNIYKPLIRSFLRDTLLLLLLVSAIIASAVAANRMIMDKPLKLFLRAIRRADEDDVREHVDWPVGDELGVVINAYNNLLETLSTAEEVVRESEVRYRTVLETSTDPIVVYDIDGKVTYFNPAFTRVFGWTLEERLGKKMDVFVPDEDWSETRKMINKVLAGENFSGFETRRYSKEGNIIQVNMSAAIYKDQDGNPIGSVINLRDISDQKKMEVQLQHAQKMEAIGTLAGGVAHDLNNILSGLISYPELLLLDISEDSPLRQPILRIKESGQKAAAIVQDLLTLARRGVSVTEVVNLNDIISDFLGTPEYDKLKALHPGAEFKINIAPDLLNTLGSPVHLSKTVMNLVSNAAESMPDSGKILISTENKYIDRPIRGYEDVQEGDYVLLSVVDSGIGISTDDLSRIFEPFYTKKEMGRSGTGLGMAVVWGTVKDHNGYIDVQSTVGKGTRCDLYFPVTRREPTGKRPVVSIDEYMGSEKILVIDDIEDQREIAHQILTRLGYSVTTVSSGEEAVVYMQENSADLLVLDMIMDPGIDGLETYKRILEFHPGQKAIIASGFSETDRVKEAQRLGVGVYIKKPYVFEKLGITVRNELDK